MALEIPTSTELPSYTQRTRLEGRDFLLVFDWNEREGRWFLSIRGAEEEPLREGLKVVVGTPLLRRAVDPRLPPGELVAVDLSGEDRDPGFDELGSRVRLLYFELAELQELGA